LVLELPRAMGVEVWSDANGVQIQLLKPDVGNGRLAGKVIVVDPGHGGRDIGCHAAGINEKDLTLAIGRLVSAELSAQGATVIMTRRSDVFIPLPERCDIANRNKADFFISCHINSSRRQTFSGSIIFHHEGRPMSQLLAECVMSEVGKVSKLPARGAWSDRKIYQSGFAVLRNTKMPGVLCEFGFINQPTDRARMVTAGFQRAVAAAVMRGIKVYLGNAKGQ
jgi:N-acetylmuramoyl-L-alanine amidase